MITLISPGDIERFVMKLKEKVITNTVQKGTLHHWNYRRRTPKTKPLFSFLDDTFASNLANDNVPEFYIRRLIGHSSTQILDVYSHVQVEKLRTAINV